MHRHELRHLSRLRLREARILLRAGAFEGAYYLIGYAVECALKACIAKRVGRHEIPDRKVINDFYTHDLAKLLGLTGFAENLERQFEADPELRESWIVVVAWNETARYNPAIPREQALELYRACVSRKHGILTRLRQQW